MSLLAARAVSTTRASPIWRSDAFIAEFADAFVGGTDLEGGNLGASLKSLLPIAREVVRKGPQDRLHLSVLPKLLSSLEHCAQLADEIQAMRLLPAATQADKFLAFLHKFLGMIKALKSGERLVFPVFWSTGARVSHVVLCIIEAGSSDTNWTFTVVNTGEGVQYHPATAETFPKIKRQTALRLGGVLRDRLLDEAVLYALLRPAFVVAHDACFLMYATVFAHIAGDSLRTASEKVCGAVHG